MHNPRIELAFALFFLALILVGFFFTSRIDLAFSSDLETFSGPRAYPGLILSVLLFLISMIIAGHIHSIYRRTDPKTDSGLKIPESSVRSAGLLVVLVVFLFAFEPVGYILTIVPLLTFAAVLCGAQSKTRALIVSILLAAVCLVIFRYGLATVLPVGLFGIDMLL